MPTLTIRDTDYPHERYVNGVLQISIDGHNWTDYIPETVGYNENGRLVYTVPTSRVPFGTRSVYDEILATINKTKSPFQEWEDSIK